MPRDQEPVEFKLIPGQEDEWAGEAEMELSPLWRWLGVYPLYGWVIATLILIGAC